jgi:hypothetical protein
MITDKGIELLGRYIVGQIPAFASHIAIGCGEQTLLTAEELDDYSSRNSLTFEMARVPVTSRTIVNDGTTYAIFTAELPSLNRYGITEIGIYPAEENNVAGSTPSQILFSFSDAEDWQEHDTAGATFSAVEIKHDLTDTDGNIDIADTAFKLASDNSIFGSNYRLNRQEQPRFLNYALAMKGDYTTRTGSAPNYELSYTANHIELNSGIDLSALDQANEVLDKIKVAFSIVPTDVDSPVTPTYTFITIEFATADTGGEYARFQMTPNVDNENRYIVEESLLKDLTKSSSAFKWSNVTHIKVYANIDDATDNYIVLDGIRFENLSDIDNQFGLVGYTVIVSSDSNGLNERPVVKVENTTSYIEFKFKIGLV